MDRVSKGGSEHFVCCPSFETAAARPPQDEVVGERLYAFSLSSEWQHACNA